jgi:hypothetical protein
MDVRILIKRKKKKATVIIIIIILGIKVILDQAIHVQVHCLTVIHVIQVDHQIHDHLHQKKDLIINNYIIKKQRYQSIFLPSFFNDNELLVFSL